ncbi:MAG: OmpA/MotB domain protein [Bacteroidetes bacterium]|jgi:outer membrane protein OmpA-like peptidoglycan-associated protein|nr:OmpA/MotB domain protein [Bacteroidota bacterium]
MKKITILLLIIFSLSSYGQEKKITPVKSSPVNYARKLLYGEKKQPLKNQKVVLKDPLSSKTFNATTDKYGDFEFKGLDVNVTYKMEISVDSLLLTKPMLHDTAKHSFNIDFSAAEFPELSTYKGTIFDVGSENTNFDKSYYTIQWNSVKIVPGPKNGNYEMILERKDKKVSMVVYPVLEEKDFKPAMEEYKEKVAIYNSLLKGAKLYMAKTDGTIIKQFKKAGNSFVYELLPAELVSLAKENEVDPVLAIKDFAASSKAELIVDQDIYYSAGSSEIKEASIPKLDKIIASMATNKSLKLIINSHTDARGDDASNMKLSQDRAQKVMDYFISKGVDKSRLTSKGFGETQLKNRCSNNVDCSEAEHRLNRRTEFKFMK